MTLRKVGARNREIFAAFQAGSAVAQLAAEYGLNPRYICEILLSEKHKRAVSPDPVYCSLRQPPILKRHQ
jgi:Mor family transcriptional regulator